MERSQARGAYIDQGESHNVFIEAPTAAKYRTIMKKGYELGLKTGSYYIRTRPAAEAIKNNTLSSGVSPAQVQSVVDNSTFVNTAVTAMDNPTTYVDDFDGPACGRGGCSG